MKKITLFAFIFSFLSSVAFGQVLLNSEFLGSKTKAQLISQTGNYLIQYGVSYFKLTYNTPDVDGNSTFATGLLVIPDNGAKIYPMLCYQHGTSGSTFEIPSELNAESTLPLTWGGLGYITFAPDYLGLGDSPGFHPYVHAATEATAGVDGMRAAREYAQANQVLYNDQVFLTGYSQGGHASMAMHRLMEQQLSSEFSVTSAAHLSGPYSISEVMRGLLLSDEPYGNPAYLVNTLFSYQYVYGNIYSDLSEAVKPAYINMVTNFSNGTISLSQLNVQLIALLTQTEGAAIPSRMFNDAFVAAIVNDPDHPANVAMRDNDVYQWAPTAPTRLFYCMADDQVPFENSVLAEVEMLALGATNLDAIDVNTTANHTGCVPLAVINTIFFFQQTQQIGDAPVSDVQDPSLPFEVYPNPASEVFFVKNFPSNGEVRLMDLQGRVQLRQPISEGDIEIVTGGLQNGLYFVDFQGKSGSFRTKLMIAN